MKTPTPTILILLLLAGGLKGYGQADILKPGLPDEEVIRLRSELVEALENYNLVEASKITYSLWDAQPTTFEYLSFEEYYLVLFFLGSYDSVAKTYPSVHPYNTDSTRFQRIDLKLSELIKPQHVEIFDSIFAKNYHWVVEIELMALFNKLIEPDNFEELVFDGFWLGTGLYYTRGWYSGDLNNFVKQYETFYPFNIHLWYHRFYFEANYGLGGGNGRDSVFLQNKASIGTHYINSVSVKLIVGYRAYRNKIIDITPYIGYLWLDNKLSQIRHKNDALLVGDINHDGIIAGINADLRFFNDLYNQVAFRLKYEISASRDNPNQNNIRGLANHISIGIIYSGNIGY